MNDRGSFAHQCMLNVCRQWAAGSAPTAWCSGVSANYFKTVLALTFVCAFRLPLLGKVRAETPLTARGASTIISGASFTSIYSLLDLKPIFTLTCVAWRYSTDSTISANTVCSTCVVIAEVNVLAVLYFRQTKLPRFQTLSGNLPFTQWCAVHREAVLAFPHCFRVQEHLGLCSGRVDAGCWDATRDRLTRTNSNEAPIGTTACHKTCLAMRTVVHCITAFTHDLELRV